MDHMTTAPLPLKQQNGGNGLLHKTTDMTQRSGNGILDTDGSKLSGTLTLSLRTATQAKQSAKLTMKNNDAEQQEPLAMPSTTPSHSKLATGPLPLSFFGEEENSDLLDQTVSASTGSGGALETGTNGGQKELEMFVDNYSERDVSDTHGLDSETDFDFGDFESVPAQMPTSDFGSHMHAVASNTFEVHGFAAPAAFQRQSQLDQSLPSLAGAAPDNGPSPPFAWASSQGAGFEVEGNSIHGDNGAIAEQRDEGTSDEEWGDFVAPEASRATSGFWQDAAWGVHVSNNGNAALENMCTAAADVAQAHVASATSTIGRGLVRPELDNSGLHDDLFSFDETPVLTNARLHVKMDEATDVLGHKALDMNPLSLNIGGTDAPSPLDLLGETLTPWNPLTAPGSDLTRTSRTVPEFGDSSDEVDPNEIALNSELEDEDMWDWVAAETSGKQAEGYDMDIADNLGGHSFSGPEAATVSNGTAEHNCIPEEKNAGQGLLFSPHPDTASGEISNGALFGASVDKESTVCVEVEGADLADRMKVRNSAAPLPLSLFGEDEVGKDPSLDSEVKLTLDGDQTKTLSIKRTQSLNLPGANFSDLIASLYPHQQTSQSNSFKKTSHRRSRSSSIQVFSSDGVDFFFSEVDSHPLQSSQTEHHGIEGSFESDAGILLSHGSMLDADATSEDEVDYESAPGSPVPSPSQGKGLSSHGSPGPEDILNMDLHSALDESVNLEDIYLGGFGFQYRDEGGLGANVIRAINVDDRGSDKISALQKLILCLISEGRVREAHHCKQHTAAVSCLPQLQEAYSNAIELGEFEKAAAAAKEIEVARTSLARPEDLKRWQSRLRHLLVDQPAHEQVCRGGLSVITIDEMVELLGKSRSDARAAVLMSLFDAQEVNRLAESDLGAAVELHAHAVHTFRVLSCASSEEQVVCVTAWSQLASVCASELEHASDIWLSAVNAEAQTRLLDMPQGKSFFAAVGQIFVVSSVLSATLKVYKPWLAVAKDQGQAASEAVERCHNVWLNSTLQDAVRLSLVSSIHTLPMTTASWVEIQKLPRAAKTAIIQAAGRSISDSSSDRFCGLSLLPLLPFTAIPAVEWEGRHYLLPLANLWANTISPKPPGLPLLKIGELRSS